MSANADAIITAGLRPELFAGRGLLAHSRTLILVALAVLVVAGFGFRVSALSAEGLSEDELNKLNAVADYRAHGLTGANGEHPMLMKAVQAVSIIAAEKWNALDPANPISPETALRLPNVIAGALTALLIYLIAAELFGAEVALIAAALWAFNPSAIAFSRIAKEDTFLLFFFLLANVFWLRGQRVAESTDRNPNKYYWATAACYGAMVASKYLPHLFAVSICYYWMFQQLPETRWRLGKIKMLKCLAIMGLTFLLLSPTILLPETWRQMGLFAGGQRVVHDSYEFMGQLYPQRFGDWLHCVPACLAVIVIVTSLVNSIQAAPHFRLYTNPFGGGMNWAGYYFPHDEFYDASMRDVIGEIAARAPAGARVVSESPTLASYYAQRDGRPDLVFVSLSDDEGLKDLTAGDFVIIARGRRYFSNDALINALRDHATPLLTFNLGSTPSATVYRLDDRSLGLLK